MAAASQELLPAIPRQAGVSEGVWDKADASAVSEALADAQASTSGRTPGTGLQAFHVIESEGLPVHL